MRSLSKEVAELVAESFVLDELEAALAEGHRDGTASVGFGEHRHEASPRHKRGH